MCKSLYLPTTPKGPVGFEPVQVPPECPRSQQKEEKKQKQEALEDWRVKKGKAPHEEAVNPGRRIPATSGP